MEKKQIRIFTVMAEFEAFVNSPDVEVITMDIKAVEQSAWFQESFIAIVYFKSITPATEDKKAPDSTAESFYERFVPYEWNEINQATKDGILKAMQEFGLQERNRLCDKMKEILYDDSFSSQEKIGELKKIV